MSVTQFTLFSDFTTDIGELIEIPYIMTSIADMQGGVVFPDCFNICYMSKSHFVGIEKYVAQYMIPVSLM